MRPYDLVHPHCQREIVRREFEQRVSADVDFVKEKLGKERRQPEWLSVCDEMDFVATIRQRDAKPWPRQPDRRRSDNT